MKKIMILGQEQHRETLLQKIHEAGVVHLEPLQAVESKELAPLEENLQVVEESIKILAQYPQSKKIAPMQGSWLEIAQAIHQLDKQIKNLELLKSEQEAQLAIMSVWGNFSSKLLQTLQESGVKIQLWRVLSQDAGKFEAEWIPWQKQQKQEVLLATVSYQKPVLAPETAQEILIKEGPQELQTLLADTLSEIQKNKDNLASFVNLMFALKTYADELQDIIALLKAKAGLLQQSSFFGLRGWIPITQEAKIWDTCRDLPVVIQLVNPAHDEQPPTLMQNPKWIQSILDVVLIYATPGYQEWDPSISVYFAFAVFFAMIVGDAGYGLVILSLMLWFRSRLITSAVGTRIYRLFVTISLSCIVYGAISGTWFAINFSKLPESGSLANLRWLQQLQCIDSSNTSTMMLIAIYTGVVHLSIARFVQIIRLWPKTLVVAEFAWIIGLWSAMGMLHLQHPYAKYAFIGSLVLVFLFSSTSFNPLRRIGEGILGLLGITQLFADVLSYLRLFALGLASSVLGSIFNDMGMKIHEAFPGIVGYILMLLVVFSGHSINLILAVMGGFIHGLRLNFLEFYRYCFEGTGYMYAPFILHQKTKP